MSYKIKITTYETNKKILAHCFYGDTLDEAISYAKSHLISDYFFCSTFVGQMKWGSGQLILNYDGKILNITQKRTNKVFDILEEQAKNVHTQQLDSGMVRSILKMTK